MTQVQLLQTMVSHIKEAIKDHRYMDRHGNEREVTVEAAFLKEKEMQDEGMERYVIVRALGGESGHEETTVKLRIIVAALDTDVEEGWMTVQNMIERIRQSILQQAIIGGRFTYQKPLQWTVEEDQAYPYYFAHLDMTCTIPNITYTDLDY